MDINRIIVSVHIDRHSTIPLYLQLCQSLKKLIGDGLLLPGDQIPPIRSLAHKLGVNTGTVVRALEMLEKDGMVCKHVGRGTFVAPAGGELRSDPPDEEANIQYDFSALYPSPVLFPVADFKRCLNQALDHFGGQALTYEFGPGYKPLRDELVQILVHEGITAGADDILVTSGSQQGIDLAIKALVEYGDTVFMEEPTYSGAVAVCKNRGAQIVAIPLGLGGLDFVELEKRLRFFKPRLIYVMTALQNPTGYSYTRDQKERLLQLANEYNFYILEDDYLGLLDYTPYLEKADPPSPPLKTLDQWDRVILLKTFSKILMPGLRLGFMVVPEKIKEELLTAKQATDIATAGLFQRALCFYLQEGAWPEHLELVRQEYFSRYREVLAFLKQHSPPLRYFNSRGGLSFWVRLPGDTDAVKLAVLAREKGVAIAPGASFFTRAGNSPWFRLSYAAMGVEDIKKGTALLGEVIRDLLSRTDRDGPVSFTPVV